MAFRKVTKEEFEVLSKYHASEVRYYIDPAQPAPKQPKKRNPAVNGITASGRPSKARNWNGKGHKDNLIALGSVSIGNVKKTEPAGTIKEAVRRAVIEHYHGNAFTQFRRSTLVAKVMEATKLTDPQVNPVISLLLNQRKLRVVQDDATSPLPVKTTAAATAAH